MKGYKKAAERSIAMEGLFVYRLNAFIDYVIYGNEEEREWAKVIILNYNSEQYRWRIDRRFKQSIALLRKKEVIVGLFRNGYCMNLSGQMRNKIIHCPWTLSVKDNSVSLLTRDALVCIFDRLEDPMDLFNCMKVNKSFYQAGCSPGLYPLKIRSLLIMGRIERFPFEDRNLKMHQIFFFLTFTVMQGKELVWNEFIGGEIAKGNIALLTYVCSIYMKPKDFFLVRLSDGSYDMEYEEGSICVFKQQRRYTIPDAANKASSFGSGRLVFRELRENIIKRWRGPPL